MSAPVVRRNAVLPLDTCPPEHRGVHVGDCGTCGRPMANRRRYTAALAPWFVTANNSRECRGCYWEEWKRVHAINRTHRAPALSAAEVQRLRRLVGACPACGWAADPPSTVDGEDDPGSGEHTCPSVRFRETA